MDAFNNDCLRIVFSYLKLRDLAKVEQVCTQFRDLALHSYKVYRKIDDRSEGMRTLSAARTVSAKVGEGLQNLSVFSSCTLEMLKVFLQNCPNIRNFVFEFISVQENGMLLCLDEYFTGRGGCDIQRITFQGCHLDDREDSTFFRCLENAPNLVEVDLRSNWKISGKLLKFLNNLKKIDLNSCENLQPNYFMDFCRRNTSLTSLNIERCLRLNQECINTVAEELKNLEEISIICSLLPESANLLPLADLPKLVSLDLHLCNHLAVPLLDRLDFHNRLQTLKCSIDADLYGHDKQRILHAAIKIRGLRKFSFHDDVSLNDSHLRVSTMENLEELEIPYTQVTDEGIFQFILRNPSLKFVNLIYCEQITDAFALRIIPRLHGDFQSLRINARGTRMSAENIKILTRN